MFALFVGYMMILKSLHQYSSQDIPTKVCIKWRIHCFYFS